MKKYVHILGIAGVVLLAVGGVAYAIKWEMTTPIAVTVWAGVLLSLFFFYVNFSEIRAVLTGRSVKYGANAAVMVAVFIGILSLTALMSIKYKLRWDLTATKRYTLSDQTQKILKSLKKDVEAIAFYRSDERTRQAMEDLLESYAAVSPRFSYWFVDPDKQPGTAEKYGVTSYRTTLIRSGANQEVVGYESEEKVTNAILKVTRDEVKTIYFLKGHGENNIEDDKKAGYKAVAEAIRKENFKVKDLMLTGAEGVPKDCAVLVVSGPKRELLPGEVDRIKEYIERGGSVVFMLDPGDTPKLVKFLSGYGFQIGDDIIIDSLSQVFGANYLVPVVTDYAKDHPITENFNLMTFFPLARSVSIDEKPEKGRYILAKTGTSSWGEKDRKALEEGNAEYTEGEDTPGPVPIAAVTVVKVGEKKEDKKKEGDKKEEDKKKDKAGEADDRSKRSRYGKVVVIGDSDFVSNTHINLAGNRDFFLNTVSWLAEEADLISIRKKEYGVTPVILTATQGRFVFWTSVVIPPSLVAMVGFGVFIRRRLGK